MLNTNTSASRTAAETTVDTSLPRWSRVATLAVGDLIVFLIFSATGRSNHAEAVSLSSVVVTAAPFIIGWFAVSPFLGAFGRQGSAATTRPLPLLQRTAIAWIVAWAVALLLRRFVFGGDIPPAFIIVALLVNGVLLLGWRGVASALFWRR